MSGFMSNIWPILLMIYIISPVDAFPLFHDDLIAAAVLAYILYKNFRLKKSQQQSGYSEGAGNNSAPAHEAPFGLDDAYRLIGVSPDSSLDEIKKAYRDKVVGSHPDKVNHLSEELKEKAKEITLQLNKAYDMLKQSRTN